MFLEHTNRIAVVFGFLIVTLSLGELAVAGKVNHKDLKTKIKNESEAIQSTIQTESTSIKTELTTQHDMIKTDLSDTKTVIQNDIAEVKALVEALQSGDGATPCGAGTEGQRFVANGPEVCDNTSGLYWEQALSTTNLNWPAATDRCLNLDLGNGQSYRLAKLKEIISLVDYSFGNPAEAMNAPDGPFSNVLSLPYWSATDVAGGGTHAWLVNFGNGSVSSASKEGNVFLPWCVR